MKGAVSILGLAEGMKIDPRVIGYCAANLWSRAWAKLVQSQPIIRMKMILEGNLF